MSLGIVCYRWYRGGEVGKKSLGGLQNVLLENEIILN